jgi:hypothetical protein
VKGIGSPNKWRIQFDVRFISLFTVNLEIGVPTTALSSGFHKTPKVKPTTIDNESLQLLCDTVMAIYGFLHVCFIIIQVKLIDGEWSQMYTYKDIKYNFQNYEKQVSKRW